MITHTDFQFKYKPNHVLSYFIGNACMYLKVKIEYPEFW